MQFIEVIMQNAAAATGDGAALECVRGDGIVVTKAGLQVSGTFVAGIVFEATVDGSNWVAVQGTNLNNGAATSTSSVAGIFRFDVAGLLKLRARIGSYTSGAVTVKAIGVQA